MLDLDSKLQDIFKIYKLMALKIKHYLRSILKNNYEQVKIFSFIERYCVKETAKILDVGCGEGRYLRGLISKGYDVTGIDANEALVSKNNSDGFHCITTKDLSKMENSYDLILMSHIVEHFDPSTLKLFLEGYLERLRKDGILIIATPLFNPRFYDDFDHIKPYSPVGIMMVFGSETSQVQYYSSEKIQLLDVWFRSSYFRPSNYRGRYIPSTTGRIYFLIEIASALLWRLSFGLIGRKDGWVGVFQKISQ
jgi:SAM-dependent methyltransferase